MVSLAQGRNPPCSDSCLIQDEPEREVGFSYKMSLKGRIAMLGIDHQHGRQWSNQPGADSGVFERQWRGCICGATAGRGLRLGGADAGATRVRELEACEQ